MKFPILAEFMLETRRHNHYILYENMQMLHQHLKLLSLSKKAQKIKQFDIAA